MSKRANPMTKETRTPKRANLMTKETRAKRRRTKSVYEVRSAFWKQYVDRPDWEKALDEGGFDKWWEVIGLVDRIAVEMDDVLDVPPCQSPTQWTDDSDCDPTDFDQLMDTARLVDLVSAELPAFLEKNRRKRIVKRAVSAVEEAVEAVEALRSLSI